MVVLSLLTASWSGGSVTLEKYQIPGVVSRGSEEAGGRLNAESSMEVCFECGS